MSGMRSDAVRLSDDEFGFICRFVYDSTGIVLNSSKREMVYRRLARIVRERKLQSFTQYCQLLKNNPEQESGYFINAMKNSTFNTKSRE